MILATALAGLLASTAPPQAADIFGVYRGTLGKQAVVVCLDRGYGTYYYESRRRGIELRETEGALEEGDAGYPPTGRWRIDSTTADRVAATWKSPEGKRSLPISLQRLSATVGDGGCSDNAAFNAPRFTSSVLSPSKGSSEQGLTVRRERVADIDIERMQLGLPGPAGKKIDAQLDAWFRQRLGQAYDCSNRNQPGEWTDGQRVEFIDHAWLVVSSSGSWYCGGPYPAHGQDWMVFSLRDGALVDTSTWLLHDGAAFPPALRALLADKAIKIRGSDAEDQDCIDAWREMPVGLSLRPAKGGVSIDPDFPHVVQACQETVELSLTEVGPFLTPAGRTALGLKP